MLYRLINAIDLIYVCELFRVFFFSSLDRLLPEYKEYIHENMDSRLHLKYNAIAFYHPRWAHDVVSNANLYSLNILF